MNGTEQKTHTGKTDDLDARLTNVEEVVAALDARIADVAKAAQASIGQERTHRLKLADEQRAYVDQADKEVLRAAVVAVNELRTRGLWGRLRWIVRGH